MFVAVMLNVVLAPAMAGGVAVFVTERSAARAEPTTVMPFAVVLFGGKPGKVPVMLAT